MRGKLNGSSPFITLLISYGAVFLITPWMFSSGRILLPMLYYMGVSFVLGVIINNSSLLWGFLLGCFAYIFGMMTGRSGSVDFFLNYYIPLPLVSSAGASLGEALRRKIQSKVKVNPLYSKERHTE